jgi:glycosyltransferase involved in cell wall biosynthesis
VVVAKRKSRAERGVRRLLFDSFYTVLGKLSDMPMDLNSGHFSLLDRQSLDAFLQLRERNRFLPGLRTWVGHKRGTVLYDRDERAAGTPKMSIAKLMKYGFDAIFSFSFKPLRAIWALGFVVSSFSILYALFLIALRLFHIDVVPGFTTPTVAILFLGGVQLISIGILGEYLGRIYDEVKQRPLYVIGNIFRNGAGQFAAQERVSKGVTAE